MATSGSYNFSLNRNEIIKTALAEVSAADIFDQVPQEYIKTAARWLNIMVKSWQTRGISLPFIEDIIVFLPKGENLLTLNTTGSEACFKADFIQTTASVAAVSGASTITVASNTGLVASDRIGIKLTDGTRQWTTISSIASNVITLGTTLTANVDSGASVYTYTNRIQKPMRLLDVRKKTQDSEIPVEILARKDYNSLAVKSSTGSVSQVHYQPKTTEGLLSLWQTPSNVDEYLICSFEYPIEDFDNATDDCMFPSEWYEAIVYGLAFRLGTGGKFGVAQDQLATLKALADQSFDIVNAFDQEYTYVDFIPTDGGGY